MYLVPAGFVKLVSRYHILLQIRNALFLQKKFKTGVLLGDYFNIKNKNFQEIAHYKNIFRYYYVNEENFVK